MLGFMFRKIVYVGIVTGLGAVIEYFQHKPDITEWTLHGALIAGGTALVGLVLSPIMGGSLAKK